MGCKRQSKHLNLLMNGQLVGQLSKPLGVLAFQYDTDWLVSNAPVIRILFVGIFGTFMV